MVKRCGAVASFWRSSDRASALQPCGLGLWDDVLSAGVRFVAQVRGSARFEGPYLSQEGVALIGNQVYQISGVLQVYPVDRWVGRPILRRLAG
jgi:hypothetical protein